MNRLSHWFVGLVFVLGALPLRASAGIPLNGMDWNQINNDFVVDNKEFRGNWSDAQTWPGRLCNGSYSYRIQVSGKTDKIDFNLNDDASIDVSAQVSDLYFRVEGSYRSEYSLCAPLRGWSGVSIDNAELLANAVFTEGGKDDLSDLKVTITRTNFGTIHVGSWVPHWFENFLTRLVNRAAEKVWESRVGEWLSDRLATEIRKKVPRD